MVCNLINSGQQSPHPGDFPSDQFAAFLKSKIRAIQSDLDSTSSLVGQVGVAAAPPFPSAQLAQFDPATLEDVSRAPASCIHTASVLDLHG